jgi:hypothetical protein
VYISVVVKNVILRMQKNVHVADPLLQTDGHNADKKKELKIVIS